MRVLLDCDGVLSDFIGHAIQSSEVLASKGYTSETFPAWNISAVLDPEEEAELRKEFVKEGWCASMPPRKGARQACHRLREFAEVYFVTAPYDSPYWMAERSKWLEREMGAQEGDWVMTHAKHLCVGDIFVDDKLLNVTRWHQYHPDKVAVLWEPQKPNPRHLIPDGVIAMSQWDDLVDLARGLL